MELNAPGGLGDAIYMRAVVLHLIAKGDVPTVFTRWAEVFSDLPVIVKAMGDATGEEDWHHVQYCLRCRIPATQNLDLFKMACLQAGLLEPVVLQMNWRVTNTVLLHKIKAKAGGKKILVYQSAKKAKNRQQELLQPSRAAFNGVIAAHSDHYRIRVGHPADVIDDPDVPRDLDLFGKTTIPEAFDIGTIGDLFVSMPSYLTVMAEAMDKRFLCMFTRRALNSEFPRCRNITPERIFHKPQLGEALFDES